MRFEKAAEVAAAQPGWSAGPTSPTVDGDDAIEMWEYPQVRSAIERENHPPHSMVGVHSRKVHAERQGKPPPQMANHHRRGGNSRESQRNPASPIVVVRATGRQPNPATVFRSPRALYRDDFPAIRSASDVQPVHGWDWRDTTSESTHTASRVVKATAVARKVRPRGSPCRSHQNHLAPREAPPAWGLGCPDAKAHRPEKKTIHAVSRRRALVSVPGPPPHVCELPLPTHASAPNCKNDRLSKEPRSALDKRAVAERSGAADMRQLRVNGTNAETQRYEPTRRTDHRSQAVCAAAAITGARLDASETRSPYDTLFPDV